MNDTTITEALAAIAALALDPEPDERAAGANLSLHARGDTQARRLIAALATLDPTPHVTVLPQSGCLAFRVGTITVDLYVPLAFVCDAPPVPEPEPVKFTADRIIADAREAVPA